ncbi:MAG: hypothetical protein ACOVP7_09120, partial [Lacibacter sp.]
MKNIFVFFGLMFFAADVFAQSTVAGSWSKQEGSVITTWLFQDGFYSCTKYDVTNKVFSYTKGGTYAVAGSELQMKLAFHTAEKEKVGTTETATVVVKD